MSVGHTKVVSRVKFFTKDKTTQCLVEFVDRKSIRFYSGQIVEFVDGIELSIEEIYEILYLASLKAINYVETKDLKKVESIISELVSAFSSIIYAQEILKVKFYTRGRFRDIYLTISGGGNLRLRETVMPQTLRYGILSEEQLTQVLEIGYKEVMSIRRESDHEEANSLYAEYYIYYQQLKVRVTK